MQNHSPTSGPLALCLFALALTGCGGGGSGGGAAPAPAVPYPVSPRSQLRYKHESNQGGGASQLRLIGVQWGRLVDVLDVNGLLLHEDFVVGEDIASDGVDFQLDRNAVTGRESLTVLHAFTDPAFDAAYARLEANLATVLDKGLNPSELPPFSMIPRNAALVLRFDDLLRDGQGPGEFGSINSSTVQLHAGAPPAPFEARVFPDPNHGAVVNGRFHSTRVIVDCAVSVLEAVEAGMQANAIGLPAAVVATQPNLALRIPTLPSAGATQLELLENLSGARVSYLGNGPNDPSSPTLDVVRAMRSGGGVVGDPNNGFLADDLPPQILGAQPVSAVLTGASGAGAEFLADITFGTKLCASQAKVGDVLELPGHTLLVTAPGSPPSGGVVTGVSLRPIAGEASDLLGGGSSAQVVGQYRTIWDPAGGAAPECFVQFSPVAALPPGAGVSVQADVRIAFSEPMDPASVQPFQSFQIEYGTSPDPEDPLQRRVVGNVIASPELQRFTFEPVHPLKHHGDPTQALEGYRVSIGAGLTGVTDLAGNPIANPLSVDFTIDPGQPKVVTGGVSLDFSEVDEDGNGAPEMRGQFLVDPQRGELRPRDVTRFSALVDPGQPMLRRMTVLNRSIQTPLSNLGSKMQTVWRYLDMGFSLLDDSNHNLDVEGLWWEPFDGSPQLDFFSEFEMRLAHAFYFPDDALTSLQLPSRPLSGLDLSFDRNYADLIEDPPVVVHSREEGYLVDPLVINSENGRRIVQWPMNVGKAPVDYKTMLWRDTAKLIRGGANGVGVDPAAATQLLSGQTTNQGLYPDGQIPTIGMPLLMEFRTYPDDQASGQNGFQVAFALGSSANPFFRTFSTGGILDSGQVLTVDPDQALQGVGGVNPFTGLRTPPQDSTLYFGRADFVVRVNRMHSIWFDTLGASGDFGPAVLEPRPGEQPSLTSVVVAYRGASALNNTGVAGAEPWTEADALDPYGDPFDSTQWGKRQLPDRSFTVREWPVDGDASWVDDPAQLAGARYLQVRVTMTSNALAGLSPRLSGLGLSYRR